MAITSQYFRELRRLGVFDTTAIYVVAALVFLGGFACAQREDPADARGTTVVMAVPNIEVLKPDAWDLDFLAVLPLAKLNEHGDLEGHLAQSWEHSADHVEYTFHLRPNVRWHDGVPVTAHDVKFTLDLLRHPAVAEYSWVDATVIDDSTVRIRAANPGYIDAFTRDWFVHRRIRGLSTPFRSQPDTYMEKLWVEEP